jgi:hypothetical protein
LRGKEEVAMPLKSPPESMKAIWIILEHMGGALIGTSLVHWVVGRTSQDLWYWITDVDLYPWSLGVASLILAILISARMAVRFPRLRWLLITLTFASSIALVYTAVALAPACGVSMRLQVRSIAPDLTGGCVGSYGSNGSAYYRFEIEELGGKSSYRVLYVELKTTGAIDEQYDPGESPGLDFNSGIFITLPDRRGRDLSKATRLKFEIKGEIGSGGLGIGAKDANGTEIKIVKLRDLSDKKKLSDEWELVSVNLDEFEFNNFKVDFSRLSNISFFTTNKLSGFESISFRIKSIRFER